MPASLENSAVTTGLEKISFHSNSLERQCQRIFKLLHNWTHFTCQQGNAQNPPSEASTIVNQEFQIYKLDFRKAKEPEIKLPTYVGSQKKQQKSIKASISASLTTLKPLTIWITTNCGKFLKTQKYQTTLPASSEPCIQVKKQQFEPDMEQQTGSKSRKEQVKFVYCYPAYLTSLQSTSCEMPG